MKKISVFVLLAFSFFIDAQAVSDYKYIVIPRDFTTIKGDYNLKTILTNHLKAKNYIVINEGNQPISFENCDVLKVNLLDDKSSFKNKVILKFLDCNSKELLVTKTSSLIKDYEEGYQDALKKSFALIPPSNPTSVSKEDVLNLPTESANNAKTNLAEVSLQRFTKANIIYQKVDISDNQFILINNQSSKPYAKFFKTSKPGIYRVSVDEKNGVLAYFENGDLVIDYPINEGDFVKEIFTILN